MKHLQHQPNQSKSIFLVRLRYPNRKLTRKLFHNRQTQLSGYSTTDRIKPSGYSSLLFRWLFHNAFNLKVTQRMKMKIQAIPQKIQATLGTDRKIKGLIESLPSSICMKKVSSFTCIGHIFPMITVLFRTMYDIFISKVTR